MIRNIRCPKCDHPRRARTTKESVRAKCRQYGAKYSINFTARQPRPQTPDQSADVISGAVPAASEFWDFDLDDIEDTSVIVCRSCGAEVDSEAEECSECGMVAATGRPPVVTRVEARRFPRNNHVRRFAFSAVNFEYPLSAKQTIFLLLMLAGFAHTVFNMVPIGLCFAYRDSPGGRDVVIYNTPAGTVELKYYRFGLVTDPATDRYVLSRTVHGTGGKKYEFEIEQMKLPANYGGLGIKRRRTPVSRVTMNGKAIRILLFRR